MSFLSVEELVITVRADLMFVFSEEIVSFIFHSHIYTQRISTSRRNGPSAGSISRRTSKSTQSVTTAIGFLTHTSWRIKIENRLHSWEWLYSWHLHGRSNFSVNVCFVLQFVEKQHVLLIRSFLHSWSNACGNLCLPLSPCSACTWASPRTLCWAGGRSSHASKTCILTWGTFHLCRYRIIERILLWTTIFKEPCSHC